MMKIIHLDHAMKLTKDYKRAIKTRRGFNAGFKVTPGVGYLTCTSSDRCRRFKPLKTAGTAITVFSQVTDVEWN